MFEGKAGKNQRINYSSSETWTTPLIEVGQKEKEHEKNQLNQKKKSNKNQNQL